MKLFLRGLFCLTIILFTAGCFLTVPGMIASEINKAKAGKIPGATTGGPTVDIYINELGQRDDILVIAMKAGKKLNYEPCQIDNDMIMLLDTGSSSDGWLTPKEKYIYIFVCKPNKNYIAKDEGFSSVEKVYRVEEYKQKANKANSLYIEICGMENLVGDKESHFPNLLQQYVNILQATVKENTR